MNTWHWDHLESNLFLSDKYAIRYVRPMLYRVTAFKYYRTSFRYSDTVAFYYEDYASKEDTICAAKRWCLRGELEHDVDTKPYALAPGVYVEPNPIVESSSW